MLDREKIITLVRRWLKYPDKFETKFGRWLCSECQTTIVMISPIEFKFYYDDLQTWVEVSKNCLRCRTLNVLIIPDDGRLA